MLCPHCKKEVEGYVAFKPSAPLNLNLAGGAAPCLASSWHLNTVCAAHPITFPPIVLLNFNVNGCAGGQPIHYCTF